MELNSELAVKVGKEAVSAAKGGVKRSEFCQAAADQGLLPLIGEAIAVGVVAKLDKLQRKAFISGWRVTLSRITKEEPTGEYRLVYSIDESKVTVAWELVPAVDQIEALLKRLDKLEAGDFERIVKFVQGKAAKNQAANQKQG